jgi:hypothetical protein
MATADQHPVRSPAQGFEDELGVDAQILLHIAWLLLDGDLEVAYETLDADYLGIGPQ